MPVNILQHHNGIVHDQTNGQNQGQQSQRVDGETRQSHHCKSTNQTHRNGDDGNDGCPQRSQENEDHQGDQNNRFQNSLEDALNGFVNEHRVVIGNFNDDIAWQILLQTWNHVANTLRQLQRIGCRLANNARRNGGQIIQTNPAAIVCSTLFHFGDVTNLDGETIDVANGDVAKLTRLDQISLRCHAEFSLLRLNATSRQFQVAASDGVFHILGG